MEIGTGREVGTAVMAYPHAVMDETLPDGTRLPPDWALQHPACSSYRTKAPDHPRRGAYYDFFKGQEP